MSAKHSRPRMLSALLVSLSIVIVGSLLIIQTKGFSPSAHSMKSAPLNAGTVTEYPIPTPISEPVGITSGPDGNLWFTESYGNNIGKITTNGQITEYALPHAESEPEAITADPDGNLWFTEFSSVSGNRIGKITTNGTITEYTLPNSDSESEAITSGPCGDSIPVQCLWFTEFTFTSQNDSANIGRITTSGTITEYPLATAYARANSITPGSNGVLYFTEQVNNGSDIGASVQALIGEITTSGPVQMSSLPSLPNGACLPNSITQGSDGNLWFTEYYQIGKITPGGTLIEYPIPDSSNLPDTIAAGPDGNLWFTEFMGNKIARITIS